MEADNNETLFQQTLDIEMPELLAQKKSKKIKIAALVLGVLLAITGVTLGIYFGLIQKEEKLIAKVDRNLDIMHDYSQIQIVRTDSMYSSEDENSQQIKVGFSVAYNSRKKLNHLGAIDYLYNTTLFIKKIEFNINGEKGKYEIIETPIICNYLFHENGDVEKIFVSPKSNMYEIELCEQTIESITPKLKPSENIKIEENEKGIKTIFEKPEPKKYVNPDNQEVYKGSKVIKSIRRILVDDEITEVQSHYELELSKDEDDMEGDLDIGMNDFKLTSEIKVVAEGKHNKRDDEDYQNQDVSEYVDTEGLKKKINLDEYRAIQEKNEREEKKSKEEEILFDDEDYDNVDKYRRNLGFSGKFNWSWQIATAKVLGNNVYLNYVLSLSSGSVQNYMEIKTSKITAKFGNLGQTSNKSGTSGSKSITILTIPFPGTPVPVSFDLFVSGSLSFGVHFGSNVMKTSIGGKLSVGAQVCAGVKGVATVKVGAEGTILSVEASNNLNYSNGSYKKNISLTASGGKITGFCRGELCNKKVFDISKEFGSGWSKKL